MYDINHYIRSYDNFFSSEFCNSLIQKYESVWEEEQKKIKELSLCANCSQCNCNRVDVMQHKLFKDDINFIASEFDKAKDVYFRDTKTEKIQLPEKYGFENIKIKKYTKNTEQQFKDHVDVGNYESARRFLVFLVYLNDNFEGGETVFNLSGLTFKPKQGTLVMFPPFWTHLHHANKVTGNESKYFVGSYLHYL